MRFAKWTLIPLSISLMALGCRQTCFVKCSNFELQSGDLLFQDSDCGPLCDAIEKVTTGVEGANFTHVGIIAKGGSDNFVVIEAVSSGVKATELQIFLNRSSDLKGRPKVVVGRLKRPYRRLISGALQEALNLEGKPYDKVFAINNDAYYCSEFVYEIFRRANNDNPVFTLQPMTFKDPDTGEPLPAWQKYFSDLGVSIPEGQPGINPGGISRSDALTIVYAYGEPSQKPLSRR